MSGIGTLNEKPLHEALKRWYVRPGDTVETQVEGFVVDIVRGNLLVEIQTKNFSAIRRKLESLLKEHEVRLVYPIPQEKWIVKSGRDKDEPSTRRRSPKRGTYEHVFEELIRIPRLLANPKFSMDLVLTEEEELRRFDGVRGWRRGGWITSERRLLRVVESRRIDAPQGIVAFIPDGLNEPFSVADLATATGRPRKLAQKMAYCLSRMGCVVQTGKQGNAILYARRKA